MHSFVKHIKIYFGVKNVSIDIFNESIFKGCETTLLKREHTNNHYVVTVAIIFFEHFK